MHQRLHLSFSVAEGPKSQVDSHATTGEFVAVLIVGLPQCESFVQESMPPDLLSSILAHLELS